MNLRVSFFMLPRLRAGLIHLSISLVVALVAVGEVFFIWYPPPLDRAVGVAGVFLILLGVDMIIGPLLTTLVYKPDKKSLRFDLATIACLQAAAFAYGLWTVSEGRPVWLVFNVDRFDLVQAFQVDARKPEEVRPEYQHPSWSGPRWASVWWPEEVEARNAILFEALASGLDIPQRPKYYQELSKDAATISLKAHPLTELTRYNAKSAVDASLSAWPEANAYLPMMARTRPVVVLLVKESAKVVAVVDLAPW